MLMRLLHTSSRASLESELLLHILEIGCTFVCLSPGRREDPIQPPVRSPSRVRQLLAFLALRVDARMRGGAWPQATAQHWESCCETRPRERVHFINLEASQLLLVSLQRRELNSLASMVV